MPHVIRTSASRSFRSCRRRWDWAYREGYYPLEEPKPLEFGRAFHSAFEEIYNVERWKTTSPKQKLDLAVTRFTEECELQRKQYLTDFSVPRLDREQQDDYDGRIVLGTKMLEHYIWNVHVLYDDWFTPVEVELEFEVPILDDSGQPVHCWDRRCGQDHSYGDVLVYQGRVDVIVEDVMGGYYIVDWKTASALRARADLLWMDDQICRYCWALRHMMNIDIRGFLYVEILKAFPEPPKLLTRKYKGAMFSRDKNAPTEYDLFRKTVESDDNLAFRQGVYDEHLEFLASEEAPKFHQRFKIRKTPAELKEVGNTVALEAMDMVSNPRIYPSTGRFSCPSCAYRSPCSMKMQGEDFLYTLETMFRKAN